MQPRNGSSTPSPRRARFDEDEGNRSSAGIDQDLMREAFESQAALQREQAQQRLAPAAPKPPSNGSPFAPGYSLAGSTLDAERAQRSALASDVSPLDPSPAPARAGRASFAQDEEESDIGEDDEPAGWQSCKGRRSTSGHISTPFGAGAGPEEDEAPPAETLGGNAGFLSANAQGLQSNAGGGASRPTGQRPPALRLPQRPEPTAELPFFHRQQVPNASPRPPSGVFSPQQPGGPWQAPMSPNGGSTTPHIQRYDPFSSPSMVQPFSPRVTSSGSIKSPNLKPALVRRDQSVENFKLDDSGDSLERGAVRSTDAEDVRKTFGGTTGFGKALAGLYASATSANDGSDGRSGVKMPDLRRKDSAQSLGGSTLNGNDGRKGSNDWNEKQHDDEAQEVAAWARRPSLAWTQGEDDDELDEDDPRLTGKIRKSMQLKREKEFEHRRSSWSSESGDPNVPVRRRTAPANQGRRKSFASLREIAATAGKSMGNEGEDDDKPKNVFDRRKSTTTITYNVAHVMHRQKFILKLAKALMLFGAPSHRIESQLNATANVLEVDAQFIHFPGIVIASFGDVDKHTSETHFVKSKSDLALGPLHDVHIIYRKVVHDEIGVQEGTEALNKVLKAKACWSVWSRIAFAAARCFIMAPMSFGGSFADACIAACFGAGLTFLQLRTAKKNALYSNVFEISTAILISFVARGLSTTGIFCYQSIASSALILVLPGYVILCGSLELASKNMIAGSVRMVYAIIYSLFLGFGIAIGSDVYFLLDPAARKTMYVPLESSTMVEGSFTMANQTMPLWTGSFSFTNGTRNALNVGTINCERLPEWPWYRQPISPWFNFLFVPAFSLLSCFNLLQPLRSWDVLVMVTIACVGWTANMTANHFVFNRSDVVSAIGSFIIGILGNVYSRLFRGTAFTATAVAVLFLVPSGMAMAGGLAMTYKGSDGDLYSNGLSIGFRMIQVAIGITVGLFASGLVVYSLGRKKGGALFAF